MGVIALSLVGPTASGKSAVALELARRDRALELVSVDSMQVYRGMDIGTAKPTPAEQAEVVHHLIDLVDPDEEYDVARFQTTSPRRWPASRRAATGRSSSAAPASTCGPPSTGSTSRAGSPTVRAELEADPDTVALHRRLAELDPVGAARHGAGEPSAGGPGPGGDARQRPAVLVVRSRARDLPAARLPDRGPRGSIATALDARIEQRFARQLEDGFLDEVRRLSALPNGLSRTAGQALGYRELLAHLDGGLDAGRGRRPGDPADPALRPPPAAVVPA